MDKPDVNALAQKMIEAVRGYVAKAEAAFGARMASMEEKIAAIPAGPKGEKGDPGSAGAAGAPGERGTDGAPGPGGEVGPRGEKGEAGGTGERGASGDTGPEGSQGPQGAPGARGADGGRGEQGPAGESIKGDAGPKGELGARGDRGEVGLQGERGIKGDAGDPGRDAAELDILPSIDEAKSYRRGTWASHNGGLIRAARQTDVVKNGAIVDAGWVVMVEGIAAVVVTQGEDPRALEVAAMLTSGTKAVCGFTLPVMIYREVWREGEYAKGDVVTWGGSAWHCQQKTTDKPGTSAAWRLMVKEGARGKDGDARAAVAREPVRLK